MTQKSYYHNGAWAGDAAEAPYSAELYTKLNSLVIQGVHSYVYEDVAGELLTPSAGANLTVVVGAGKAMIAGILYSNSGNVTLTLPANSSGMDRIDRIVVRVNWETQTARLVVKNGTPATVASPPALTQEAGSLYEMPIARIYVPDSLAAMTYEYIFDERQFSYEYKNLTDAWSYIPKNLMWNTEFMAASGTSQHGGAVARGYAPMYWTLTGNAEAEQADKFPQMERGSTVLTTLPGAADDLRTTLYNISIHTTLPTTTKLLIEVLQGEVYLTVGADDKIIPVTSGPVEVVVRNTHGAGLPSLLIVVGNNLATETIFKLGQVTVAYGNAAAAFQSQREIIFFSRPLSVAGYAGTEIFTAAPTNDTYHALPTETCQGITALLSKVGCKDSAGSSEVYLRNAETSADYVVVTNVVGKALGYLYAQGWVGVEPIRPYPDNAREQAYTIYVDPGGAGNTYVDIKHVGCIT